MSLKISRPTPKNFARPLATDYTAEFSGFLSENFLEPDPKKGLVTDGSIGRAYINVGNTRKLVGWYQLCERHPYLEKKGVLSYGGLRVNDQGILMLPMYDAQMTIVGIQFISPDGSKKFLTGSKKTGSFFILGQEILKTSQVINFAEGYATAASYHSDFSQPVIVAFDAYNLTPVAEVVFEFLKDRKFIFIADNDPDSNTGEKEAVKACQAIRKLKGQADVFMPESKGDYNDHATQIKALEGELISPTLRNIDVPVDFDFVRGSTGRYLNTKDNVQGVLTVNGIQVVYNVIKKRPRLLRSRTAPSIWASPIPGYGTISRC